MVWVWLGLSLGLSLVIAMGYLELNRIVDELRYVNTHETNAEVTLRTSWPLFKRLADQINANLIQNRLLKERHLQQEQRIHAMLTNLTHDIKTPLTVASGYVQLMRKAAPEDDGLMRISHNLSSVNYYLHYLMDFNLIQEESYKLNLAEVDLTGLVQSQLFDVFDDLSAKRFELTPELGDGIHVPADETLVTRICQNLISNWVKHAGKQLQVRLEVVDTQHVQLEFANTITGPSPDLNRMTARFYTGDTARKDSRGLGLSIVQGLMTQLGGQMTLLMKDNWFRVVLTFKR